MESHLTRDGASQNWMSSRWRRPLVRASFSISALSLLIFLALSLIVLRELPPLRFDTSVTLYLQQHTSRVGMRAMGLISALADPGVPLIGIAGVALLALRRRWADLALWLVALGGGLVINTSLKDFFDGRRPEWADPLRMGHGWQFPSGHVLGATIGYGLIMLLLWSRFGQAGVRVAFVLGLVALLLLIGFSRLYIRDHYLGDVLAGYAVGLSWLMFCIGVWAACRPQPDMLQ